MNLSTLKNLINHNQLRMLFQTSTMFNNTLFFHKNIFIMEEIITKKELNLAFAGVGWIGLNRLKSITRNSNAKALLLYDPSSDALRKASEVVPLAKTVDTFNEMLSHPDVDGAVIATPNFLHYTQSIEALNNGIPVFCQKPLSKNSQETYEILDAAKKQNKSLVVDYTYRCTKAFRSLQNTIAQDELGEIYSADLVFHNAYGPEKAWCYNFELSGGGCLLDLGVHLIDMALIILNFPEVKLLNSNLYSKGNKLKSREQVVEDYAQASLITENNCLINIACSWNLNIGKGAEIKLLFNGTKGTAQLSNINGSFFDFRTELFKGDKTYELFSGNDDWGSRLALEWIDKITQDNSFDEESLKYLNTAEVIDKIYER